MENQSTEAPSSQQLDAAELLKQHYASWKEWEAPPDLSEHEDVFDAEMRRAGVRAPATVLEIGFGGGAFLDWATREGFEVAGLEINEQFVEQASRRGHRVHHGSVEDVFAGQTELFDLVVLFDVLEHLTGDELLAMFAGLARLLRRNGRVLARFPNGASPFGRYYQNSDATHKTQLTGDICQQLGAVYGLALIGQFNSARHANASIKEGLRRAAKTVVELVLSRLYYPKRVPLDPNVTVVLQKTDDKTRV